MENNQTDNHATYEETLKYILGNALVHLDNLGVEIRKIQDSSDNDLTKLDPEVIQRARLLDITMIAINDIIHPAHELLDGFFKGNETYFTMLKDAHAKARDIGMLFRGCGCNSCKNTIPTMTPNEINELQKQKDNLTVN